MQVITDQELLAEFHRIESYSTKLTISEKEFFKEINFLDAKYSTKEYYLLNIDGILGNLAHDLKNENLSNVVIYRLKAKLKKTESNRLKIPTYANALGTANM